MRSTEEQIAKSSEGSEVAATQERMLRQIEDQSFQMIDKFFAKLGGERAVESFLNAKYPQLVAGGGRSIRSSMGRSTNSKNVVTEQPRFVTSQLTH